MKKFYIIPGWTEFSRYRTYQTLEKLVESKNYEVVFYDIDWEKQLSLQTFPVQKDDAVFGFSLGAILAKLIAQEYECDKILLASMTPLYSFEDKKIRGELINLLGKDLVDDISKNLKKKNKARKEIKFYGDREKESGDIIIPRTGHRLNKRYIKAILEAL